MKIKPIQSLASKLDQLQLSPWELAALDRILTRAASVEEADVEGFMAPTISTAAIGGIDLNPQRLRLAVGKVRAGICICIEDECSCRRATDPVPGA